MKLGERQESRRGQQDVSHLGVSNNASGAVRGIGLLDDAIDITRLGRKMFHCRYADRDRRIVERATSRHTF